MFGVVEFKIRCCKFKIMSFGRWLGNSLADICVKNSRFLAAEFDPNDHWKRFASCCDFQKDFIFFNNMKILPFQNFNFYMHRL